MVGGGVLQHQALVPLDGLEDGGLLNRPLANVRPVLFRLRVLLLGVGRSPSLLPVVGKLLEEGGFDGSGLIESLAGGELRPTDCKRAHTVNVGRSMADEVASGAASASSAWT
jgi:hypothetical protein